MSPLLLSVLAVAAGGAVGILIRLGISFLPVGTAGFPYKTMGIVLFAALLIGAAAALVDHANLGKNAQLFIEAGMGGGFILFSVFSLETIRFIRSRHTATGIAFAFVSAILCAAGVFGNKAVIGMLF